MVVTIVYFINHLKDIVGWIGRTLKSGFVVSITSEAHGRNSNTPFAPTIISEQTLMSSHPHESLNSMGPFPAPQGQPVSLEGLTYKTLIKIGILELKVVVLI
jgi:hypothetical protein